MKITIKYFSLALVIAVLAVSNAVALGSTAIEGAADTTVLNDIGGPDQFGYRWVDSDQAWGPEYEWIDISEVGTQIEEMMETSYDIMYGPYSLGFDFPFYGESYDEVWISRYGYITFNEMEADEGTPHNQHLPDEWRDSPNNIIAMLWTNLYPFYTSQEDFNRARPVYYYHDEENDRFILSFLHTSYSKSCSPFGIEQPVSDVSFQVVLYADGRILLQYGSMYDGDCGEIDENGYAENRCKYNNGTVVIGIENAAGDDGLEIVFNEPYIHDNLAIFIYPGTLYDNDIAPLSFLSPTEPWQAPNAFYPLVKFENQGALAASFDVNLTISYDGSVVYNESQSINNLESLTSTDVEFPEYTPADSGIYTLTAVSLLDSDQNNPNDTITVDFEVLPIYLPPSNMHATNSQNGIVSLSWYEPGTPPCSLGVYDNNDIVGAFYWGGYVFANEFNVTAPAELCSVFVRVVSNCDYPYLFWPDYPDAIHDSLKVYVMGDDGSGMPVDTLANLTVTANYNNGGWISYAFDPPLIVESDKFWVGYANIIEDGYYDAFAYDRHMNYPYNQWYGDEDGVWHDERLWNGDFKIRASFIEGGIEVSNEGLNIVGYNVYRDTQPGVSIDESNLIAEQITGSSYSDEDVENGSTYYYVATVVYTDGENVIESVPSDEVSATPAAGGQIAASEESIEIEVQAGKIDTTRVTLTNDGDLDVSFSIAVSTDNDLALAKVAGDNRRSIAPEDAYRHLEIDDNGNIFDGEIPDTPVTTGYATPDGFGYTWIDSDEDNGPEYNWIDPTEHEEVDFNGDVSGRMYLDFDFPFYDNTFSSLYITKLGYISFTSNGASERIFGSLPTVNAPPNLIAPFWANLIIRSIRPEGGVYFYSDNNKAIITWVELALHNAWDPEANNYSYTFQLVLYPDGRILLQYKEMIGDYFCGIVGIQNSDGTIATQMVTMSEYIHDELATLIQVPWLRAEPSTGIMPANGSITLNVISNSTGLESNTYTGNIDIFSGDMNRTLDNVNITVNMIRTDIEEEEDILPMDYDLLSNYPNPFNATTSIRFALSKADKVSLNVYDIRGCLTKSLYNGDLAAGNHSIVWDGTNQSGSKVSSGIYFYRLQTSDDTRNNRMILLK